MTDHILVSVAWPYANADIHVGNIVGAYLPADIFARYHRLAGNRVLMVSGTDAHGTPITVRADAEGTSPQAVYQRFHQRFLELFLKLGLSYDLFTTTHTRNHFRVSQDIFTALLDHGYLYRQEEPQWYAASEGRFLPVGFSPMVGAPGEGRSLEGLVVRPRGAHVLLHRQGQHPVPRRHLAGPAHRHRAIVRRRPPPQAQSPLRRPGQRVSQPGGSEDLRQPQLGGVGPGRAGARRSGSAALLPGGGAAGRARLR